MPELSRRIPYRTWPGAFAVLAAILAYVGLLTWWDRHTPGDRELDPEEALSVRHVRFVPVDGWRMDVARSRVGQSLSLLKGSHRFEVNVEPWDGGPQGPLVRMQRLMERGQGFRIDGGMSPFLNTWGLEGITFAYYGARSAGRLWQSVDTARRMRVEIDFYGPNEGTGEAIEEAQSMVDSMDFDAP